MGGMGLVGLIDVEYCVVGALRKLAKRETNGSVNDGTIGSDYELFFSRF